MCEVTSTGRNTEKRLKREKDGPNTRKGFREGVGGAGQAGSGHPVQEREVEAHAWTQWGHPTPKTKLTAKVATLRDTWVARPNCTHFGALQSVGEIWCLIWRAPSFHTVHLVDNQGQHHRNNRLESNAKLVLSPYFTDEQLEAQISELHYSNSVNKEQRQNLTPS